MADHSATIAAIATAPGVGGIGVVRVSGAEVPAMATSLLGRAPRPRHAHYVALREADGGLIDRGLLLYFPAPASYTGEDVMELQVHGSRPLLRVLLRRLRELGARQARPGEFTERAFLNAKLDLAQAEAVADLIEAGSEAAARAAQRSLQGEFSRAVNSLVEAVITLRVQLEAAIDFSDEAIELLAPARLAAELVRVEQQLEALLAEAGRGRRLLDGLHVVILGPPNVGKSSLLNALTGDERAIVTAQAGTTRDVLRETLALDGVELTLVDTAGLRDSADPIEREGVRRAQAEAGQADLVVLVQAAGEAHLPDMVPSGIAHVVVHNKIDLVDGRPAREWLDGVEHIHLSARDGRGLELLRASLGERAGARDEGSFSARQRHLEALERALVQLRAAARAMAADTALELAAEDLRQVQASLGEITGSFGSEALLGRIFANFCIGK